MPAAIPPALANGLLYAVVWLQARLPVGPVLLSLLVIAAGWALGSVAAHLGHSMGGRLVGWTVSAAATAATVLLVAGIWGVVV